MPNTCSFPFGRKIGNGRKYFDRSFIIEKLFFRSRLFIRQSEDAEKDALGEQDRTTESPNELCLCLTDSYHGLFLVSSISLPYISFLTS